MGFVDIFDSSTLGFPYLCCACMRLIGHRALSGKCKGVLSVKAHGPMLCKLTIPLILSHLFKFPNYGKTKCIFHKWLRLSMNVLLYQLNSCLVNGLSHLYLMKADHPHLNECDARFLLTYSCNCSREQCMNF